MKEIAVLPLIAIFAACSGDSSSCTTQPNQESGYSSSEQQSQTESSSSEGSPDIIVTPPSSQTSNPWESQHFETYDDRKVVCKGPYYNIPINNVQYFETYLCENGNICAPNMTAACTLDECRSESVYACLDHPHMTEENFEKFYVLGDCEDGLCKIYCYNNEIVLDDGDILKVIECDNKITYLRDGAIDRIKAGKTVPDYIQDTPAPNSEFAVNCERGEDICLNKADDGWCFYSHATIECPYREN